MASEQRFVLPQVGSTVSVSVLCSAVVVSVSQITSLFEISTLVGILLSPVLLLIAVVFTDNLPTFLGVTQE